MSKAIDIGFSDAKGKIVNKPGVGMLFASGTTVPTDATTGYAPGCIFIHEDGLANGTFYINDGTATSCLFKPLPASALALLGTPASMAEVVITTNVITAEETGKTFYLSLVGGFTSTLPAPALGLVYKFIVKTAPTTAYIIVTSGGANLMFGMMVERAGGAGVAGAARDTFNFVASQAIVGDWVEFYSDGTNWYYHGMVDVAAGNTVAQT